MKYGSEYTRKYYVVFSDSERKKWWTRWLKKGFRHVHVLRKSDFGEHWILANAVGGNIFLDTFPHVDLCNIYKNEVIVEYWSHMHDEPFFKIAQLNCVEMVKMVLGIRRLSILTPYQLYKHISGVNHG